MPYELLLAICFRQPRVGVAGHGALATPFDCQFDFLIESFNEK